MSNTGMTTMEVRKINRNRIYTYIYREKRTSKQQIAANLHIGLSTVTQNLKILEEEGLIKRDEFYKSTGGRKAQAIQIVPTAGISIGISILKKMILLAAVDLYGNIIKSATVPLAFSETDAYGELLGAELQQFILDSTFKEERILGVSIAIQGIVSPDGQSVSYGAIMHHTGMKLSELSSHIPYPCRFEHDSKAAGYLELWNRKCRDAIVLLLNRNFGGALIIDGKIHRGLHMYGGSIEHMCLNPDGPLCYCQKRGCLETYCSADSLMAASGMDCNTFFDEVKNGNEKCLFIWEDYLKHLAFAISNLSIILDCPVIISGYLAPYFSEKDLTWLNAAVSTSSPFPTAASRILRSDCGQFAPALGTALYYTDQFLQNI